MGQRSNRAQVTHQATSASSESNTAGQATGSTWAATAFLQVLSYALVRWGKGVEGKWCMCLKAELRSARLVRMLFQ